MSKDLDEDFPLPIMGPFVRTKTTMNAFNELSVVDCSAHVEKKGNFTYLSWPFAFAELFKRYPTAEIQIREWDGFPAVKGVKGWMVCITVTINGVSRTQWHPVLDNNNKPIPEPDVFQINTSIQRGTVKAIALHGLGLYIYAGEDLPEGAANDSPPALDVTDWLTAIGEASDMAALKAVFALAYKTAIKANDKGAAKALNKAKDARKVALMAVTQ